MLGLWLLTGSLARAADAPDETMIVLDQELDEARREAAAALAAFGYRAGHKRGDWQVYKPKKVFEPKVLVSDEGLVRFRYPFTVPLTPRWFSKITARDSAFVGAHSEPNHDLIVTEPFVFPGRTKTARKLADVSDALVQPTADLREIAASRAHAARMAEVPDELERAWNEGVTPEGRKLATFPERCRYLLELWASRTDTREGNAVRAVIGDFIVLVVQASEHPCTDEELDAVGF